MQQTPLMRIYVRNVSAQAEQVETCIDAFPASPRYDFEYSRPHSAAAGLDNGGLGGTVGPCGYAVVLWVLVAVGALWYCEYHMVL